MPSTQGLRLHASVYTHTLLLHACIVATHKRDVHTRTICFCDELATSFVRGITYSLAAGFEQLRVSPVRRAEIAQDVVD